MHRSNFGKRGHNPLMGVVASAKQRAEQTSQKVAQANQSIDTLVRKLAAVDNKLNILLNSLTHGSVLDDLANRLSKLEGSVNDGHSSARNNTEYLAKILRSILSKPVSEKKNNDKVIIGQMNEIIDKLDGIVSGAPDEEAPGWLSEVINYLNSPKKVLRDGSGNITGWKIDRGKLN